MPRAVFHLFLFASSVKFEASRFAFAANLSSNPSTPAISLTLSALRDNVNLPFSAVVVIPESVLPTTLRPSLSFTSPFVLPSPFIANFEASTASVTLVVNSLFVITLVSTKFVSPNVYFLLSPALIVKVPLSSVVIELMSLRSLFNVYFIPLASLLAITFLSPKKLSVPLAPIVAPSVDSSALAVNSCFVFKSLMPRAVFHTSAYVSLAVLPVLLLKFFASKSAFAFN